MALRARGHECLVVTRQDDIDSSVIDHYQGIPLYRFPFWSALASFDTAQVTRFRQQIVDLKRVFSPDVIHLNTLGPSVFFHLDTAGIDPVPSLVTLHGERALAPRRTPIPGRVLRDVNWVIGSSAMVLELARRKVPEMSDRSSVIYNGVERPQIAPEPLPIRAPRLLCLGRLSPEKGFDLALTIFAALVRRYQGLRLVIAGDGPARTELECLARTLHIETSVDFLGWVAPEAVPSLLNSVTLVLMPSRSESLPLAALEAGLMARPVVAARVGGLPEVVVNEETGLLVEREDVRALTEAVSFLLENADAAVRMGVNARERAQQVFGWRQHVDAYDALYRRLGHGRRE